MKADTAHIIEDDEQMVDLLRQCLQRFGLSRFIVSSNFEHAKQNIESKEFEVVILDIYLRDANGLELIEMIKNAHPKCKVIVCSGNVSRENVTEALQKGANGILAKPFNFKTFEQVMTRAEINTKKRA